MDCISRLPSELIRVIFSTQDELQLNQGRLVSNLFCQTIDDSRPSLYPPQYAAIKAEYKQVLDDTVEQSRRKLVEIGFRTLTLESAQKTLRDHTASGWKKWIRKIYIESYFQSPLLITIFNLFRNLYPIRIEIERQESQAKEIKALENQRKGLLSPPKDALSPIQAIYTRKKKDERLFQRIMDLFGGKSSYEALPILNLGDRLGSTGYIDFLTPQDLTAPIMRGRDRQDKVFFVIMDGDRCQAFFQRSPHDPNTWVDGDAGWPIINISGAWIDTGFINEKIYEQIQNLVRCVRIKQRISDLFGGQSNLDALLSLEIKDRSADDIGFIRQEELTAPIMWGWDRHDRNFFVIQADNKCQHFFQKDDGSWAAGGDSIIDISGDWIDKGIVNEAAYQKIKDLIARVRADAPLPSSPGI